MIQTIRCPQCGHYAQVAVADGADYSFRCVKCERAFHVRGEQAIEVTTALPEIESVRTAAMGAAPVEPFDRPDDYLSLEGPAMPVESGHDST